MSSSVPLLPPFGAAPGTNWFNTAMGWNRDQIFNWLGQVSRGETGGEAVQDPAVKEILAKILDQLTSLCLPSGANYVNPQPQCHILRQLNSAYDPANEADVIFKLLVWANKYKYAGKEWTISFFNPYDLLGLFFSLLGPAPQAAEQYNYFLPLGAVYARWCTRIAGTKNNKADPSPTVGVGDWPFMYQCSWRPVSDANPKKSFFLGSSLGGDNFFKAGRKDAWREILQRRRFDIIYRSAGANMFQLGDFGNIGDVVVGGKNNPGNCAETYCFTHMMQASADENKKVHGYAFSKHSMIKGNPTTYDEAAFKKWLVSPCDTCTHAIMKAGGTYNNFMDGVVVRPPKP